MISLNNRYKLNTDTNYYTYFWIDELAVVVFIGTLVVSFCFLFLTGVLELSLSSISLFVFVSSNSFKYNPFSSEYHPI